MVETHVCMSPEVWDGVWHERQQIMSRLARTDRVIFVEPDRDFYTSYLNGQYRNLRQLIRLRSRAVLPNLTVYSGPLGLPYAGTVLPASVLRVTSPLVAAINCASAGFHLRRILARERASEPILWLFEPRHLGLIEKIDSKLLCYYVYDELSEFPTNVRHKQFMEACDRAMATKADLVFVSSRSQFDRRRHLNPNTYLTPNGVDFDHFCTALDPELPIPEDMAPISKPVAGFIGWLRWQIDTELLLHVAKSMPDWSIVLVGPDHLPRQGAYWELKAQPNVHFLGFRDVKDLPRYLKAFDVAMMPYRMDDASAKHIYPCKLHEYLAGGKPVVATPLPELAPFGETVEFASSYDQYASQIRWALANDSPDRAERRLAVARDNTWDQRVSTMRAAIDALLA